MGRVREEAAAEAAGRTVNLVKWWTCMATEFIGSLEFGESFGLLELGREGRSIFVC